MKNVVANAKLPSDPKCDISSVYVTENNVQVTSSVHEDGSRNETVETYHGYMEKGYYHCTKCIQFWPWTMTNRLNVWEQVKEHLNA